MRIHQCLPSSRHSRSTLEALAELHSPGRIGAHAALGDCLATWDVLDALCIQHAQAILGTATRNSGGEQDTTLELRHLLKPSRS
ncbi:hypothetical protein ACFVTF_23020 [Kitasatospora sp. NPDC057940]|uniref:hypothetical protein n=1 Tax=Kitasatospora sp. NPDC057940 TaxID=3346285 RepID=UPI0036DAC445